MTRPKDDDTSLISDIVELLSRFALLLVFYLVVTPIGLILRATGRDAMGTRDKSNDDSCRVNSKIRDADHVRKTY